MSIGSGGLQVATCNQGCPALLLKFASYRHRYLDTRIRYFSDVMVGHFGGRSFSLGERFSEKKCLMSKKCRTDKLQHITIFSVGIAIFNAI